MRKTVQTESNFRPVAPKQGLQHRIEFHLSISRLEKKELRIANHELHDSIKKNRSLILGQPREELDAQPENATALYCVDVIHCRYAKLILP